MKLIPLGVGSANTKKYYHSNLFIKILDKGLLIDAGTTLRDSLLESNIQDTDIDYIFITHFHHDHVGGLAEFLTRSYWCFQEGHHHPHRPKIVLRSSQLQGIDSLLSPLLNNQGLTWTDYCIPIFITNEWDGMDFTIKIIPTDNLHCKGMDSYGIKIMDKKNNENIIVTGDIKELYKSNILNQIDEQTMAVIQDLSFSENPVHATFNEIVTYYGSHLEKIHGIHYEDHISPAENDYEIKLLEQGKVLFDER